MRKPEQRLWDRIRSSKHAHGVLLERIENAVGVGTPDVHALGPGARHAWIELKQVDKFPVRYNTPVLGDKGLNRDQRNWLFRYRQFGGIAYIAVGVGERMVFSFDGALCDDINRLGKLDFVQAAAGATIEELFKLLRGDA